MDDTLALLDLLHDHLHTIIPQVVLAQVDVSNIAVDCKNVGDFLCCLIPKVKAGHNEFSVDTHSHAVVFESLSRTQLVIIL